MTCAPANRIAFAGKRSDRTMPKAGGPIGLRGVALLRRVRAADGPYRCERNGDAIAWRCLEAGMLRFDSRDDDVLHLTAKGLAYLDRLMRAV